MSRNVRTWNWTGCPGCLCGLQLLEDILLACFLYEVAVETFHHACRTVLDQAEMEVDEEGVEERHHFVAMLGIRISEKIPQSSKLYFILLRF